MSRNIYNISCLMGSLRRVPRGDQQQAVEGVDGTLDEQDRGGIAGVGGQPEAALELAAAGVHAGGGRRRCDGGRAGGVKAAGSGQKVEHGVPEAVLGGGSTRLHGGRGREDWPDMTGTPMARSCRITSVYRVISAYGSDVHLPPSLREAVIGPNV